MPWLETDVQEQRIVFVVEALHPAAGDVPLAVEI